MFLQEGQNLPALLCKGIVIARDKELNSKLNLHSVECKTELLPGC